MLASTSQVPNRVAPHTMRASHETSVEGTLLNDMTSRLYVAEVAQTLDPRETPRVTLPSAGREKLSGDHQQAVLTMTRWPLDLKRCTGEP